MFAFTWYVIAFALLFMPFTFLTTTGLSNFCSLNPYLAAIFLSINIPVMPLSKSAFTVIPSCISTFSTLMFSHISLNILNILLKSLCSPLSLTAPFGLSICVLLCYTFASVGHAATLQFHYSLFLPILYSGHKIFLLSCSDTFLIITSLLLHFTHSTLVISPLFASSSLQFHTSWHKSYHMFLNCFSRRNPFILDFHGSALSCLYTLYSPHMLSPSPLLFILSQVRVHLLEVHFTFHSTLVPFLVWGVLAFSAVVPFVVWPHVLPLSLFFSSFQLLQMATYWFVIAWFDNQSTQKAKLDKQQKMLLSLRFILRHIVLKYVIVVVCTLGQPTIWSLPIVLHIGVLLFLK